MSTKLSISTRVLAVDPVSPDPAVLREAGSILRNGGLVVIPTETVYGIAANALDADAIGRLRAAKGRPETKPLPMMVSGPSEAGAFARRVPAVAQALMLRFWPGPLTIVLEAGDNVLEAVHAGTRKVGLRAPDHLVSLGALTEAGCPLVLTSANVSGEPAATTADDAARNLGGRVDLILDAGPCALGEASTVLDLTGSQPVVLRQGALSEDALLASLS